MFRFSSAVEAGQDFPERLKISNVKAGGGSSDFSRAIGVYVIDGDRVTFIPRLPERNDRSDAGLRENGEYHVFLKAGPDSLRSATGDTIVQQQEYIFDTSQYFEDPIPDQPPRASALLAVDPLSGATTEISRLDVVPFDLKQRDSEDLLAAGAVIEPGAGGPPQYATPWSLELVVSEPVDPQTGQHRDGADVPDPRERAGAGQHGERRMDGHGGQLPRAAHRRGRADPATSAGCSTSASA